MKFHTFTYFFPVPRFLKTPAIGLDLSGESIKFVGIEKKKNKFFVKSFGEEGLPPGTIEEGNISDRKNLVNILTKVSKMQKLSDVVVSLPEEKSYIFNLKVPYVSAKELRGSVELQLEEHIPLSLENIVFDFEVISYIKESNELLLNIAALPKDAVVAYTSVFEEAGLRPVVVDAEAIAIGRSIIPAGDKGTYILTDFGQDRTSISIYQDGYIRFNAILDFGSVDITKAIMKDFKISFEEAEKLKKEKGIKRTAVAQDGVFSSAVASLSVLKDEIQKYYMFWNDRAKKNQDNAKQVEKIYFSGGGAALNGFSEFMATYINTPFEIANPWVNIINIEEEIPPISKKEALRFTTAIGLALHSAYHNE